MAKESMVRGNAAQANTGPLQPQGLHVQRDALVRTLAGVSLLLLVLNLVVRLSGLEIGRLDVDIENSVPTQWSVLILSLMAVLVGGRAVLGCRVGEPKAGWCVVFLAAVFVSLDEGLAIHEELIEPVRDGLGTGGALYQAWMIPYAGLLVLGGVALAPWLRSVEPALRNRLLVSAGVFLIGAFGFEAAGGAVIENGGVDSVGYTFLTTFEEACEMAGVVLAISALFESIERLGGNVVRISS